MNNRERVVLDSIKNHISGEMLTIKALCDMEELEALAYNRDKKDLYLVGFLSGLESASHFIDLMIERLDRMNDTSEQSITGEEK